LNRILKHLLIVTFTIFATATVVSAQFPDDTNDIDWLVDVLQLKQGSTVADIGAGDGDQTVAIARKVGPQGHVYSTELGSESLEELRDAINKSEVTNVTVLEGHPKRTNLPQQCCDALFLRRVYHHFDDPAAMNSSLFQSLKQGGRLAVIDFEPRNSEADPEGLDAGNSHGVTAETGVGGLKKAGFTLTNSAPRSVRNVYVVIDKPAAG
jgi:ubiquinone/menaquinone biosynthesis C-methylase UbiE